MGTNSGKALLELLAIAGGILLLAASPAIGQVLETSDSVVMLPAIFTEHRIYVRPVTADGDTLIFYTDTGGGTNMVYAPVVERMKLPQARAPRGRDTVSVAAWPTWRTGAAIPGMADTTGPLGASLVVVPFDGEAAMLQDPGDAGFLGQRWFAGRVWTFDYPVGRLFVRPPGDLPSHDPEQRVVLGFQTNEAGRRTIQFPRIRVAVAGDSLDLLFDTGATMVLTDSALTVLDDGRARRRAASFISAAVFDRWRAEHPAWRVIERATRFGADLIEVPEVEIAGHRVGPVWFERRRAGIFEEGMSRWTDSRIVGALGGNALRFFRVTVDYPRALAIFERR